MFDIASRLSDALGIHCYEGVFMWMFVDFNCVFDYFDVVPKIFYGVVVFGNVSLLVVDCV